VRRHAEEVRLEPLTTDEVTDLFASVFGNAPHLGALSARFTALSGGRPRECLMFAEYLVEASAISYGGGSWTLPAELPDALLPSNLESAFALRVAQLGPLARHVAGLLAENLLDRLSRTDLLSIGLGRRASVDAAIHELVAARLVGGDPSGYALAGGAIARMLSATLGADERSRIHDELSAVHERAGRHTLFVVYHELCGSRAERALDRVAEITPNTELRTDFVQSAAELLGEARAALAFDRLARTAERLGRPRFELQSLLGMLASMSARGGDPAYFYRVAEAWLHQAKQDSGYDAWQELDATLEPATRAMMAVGAAAQRYGETPEADRGQTPQEGIQQLVAYVLFSIAIASRVIDRKLQVTLPEILAPFAPLNPMVSAILIDARASCLMGEGRRELARTAFVEVLEQLESVSGAELRYVEKVRAAVCYALAAIDTALGIPSVWLDRFGEVEDQNQRLSALFLRKLAALQQGDWELAEKHRREAELFSLQTKATSMFSTLGDELEVHAMARDLTGVRRVRASVRDMFEKHPGWLPTVELADAHYLRLCGDLDGALAALAPALAASGDDVLLSQWTVAGRVLAVQLMSELGREDAVALGLAELARCEAKGMRHQARNLSLSIAGAEAKLGRFDEAMNRVEAVIAEQQTLGVVGLQLGQAYEAAARIAIAAKNGDAFLRFAAGAFEQYRPGQSSVLSALYERLLDEARQAGLADDTTDTTPPRADHALLTVADLATAVAGCEHPGERAERALGLLCDGDPPTRGHLLVCKVDGLKLVASNAPCSSVREIISAATQILDHESRTSNMETSAVSSMTLGEVATGWRDTEGVEYESVVLATPVADSLCVGGIALLAKRGAPRASRLAPLANAIARTLIASGDAVSVVVM
jgi:tetratricopeptide (TPR) repeat protein